MLTLNDKYLEAFSDSDVGLDLQDPSEVEERSASFGAGCLYVILISRFDDMDDFITPGSTCIRSLGIECNVVYVPNCDPIELRKISIPPRPPKAYVFTELEYLETLSTALKIIERGHDVFFYLPKTHLPVESVSAFSVLLKRLEIQSLCLSREDIYNWNWYIENSYLNKGILSQIIVL